MKGEKANEDRVKDEGQYTQTTFIEQKLFSYGGRMYDSTSHGDHVVTPATSRLFLLPLAWLKSCHFHDTYGPLNCVGISLASQTHFHQKG